MCDEEAIEFTEGSINQETYKPGEEFNVILKVKMRSDVDLVFPLYIVSSILD